MDEPMLTLSPVLVHNAVGGVVQMYSAMVLDYERQLSMLRQGSKGDAAQLRNAENIISVGKEAHKVLCAQLEEVRQRNVKLEEQCAKLQREIDFTRGTEHMARELSDDPKG